MYKIQMSAENCYLCESVLPKRQSFFEGHNQKVCLKCFQSTQRCKKCGFPSNSLEFIEGYGQVCEFCQKELKKDTGLHCYICQKKVWETMSHYADYDKVVCQSCFKDAKIRCYFCRFPKTNEVIQGVGGVCEFCVGGLISRESDIDTITKPLLSFVNQHGHAIQKLPGINWISGSALLKYQLDCPPLAKIRFFDEMTRYYYPLIHEDGGLKCLSSIPQKWFMSLFAGQLANMDVCRKYHLEHLRDIGPFQELARGWSHYIAYSTAKTLKYDQVVKVLARFPENDLMGSFPKFLAMSEYRKPAEVITFAKEQIQTFANRYL